MNRTLLLRFGAATLACLPAAMIAQQQQPKPIGELFAADDGTKLIQPAGAGMSVVPGSELSAGVAPARLRLYRGGQVRICPRSTVSVNSGKFGLMFAMGTGNMEVDYAVAQRGADFVITPDLSLQLSGPASYHFALGVNKKGDTCVKTAADNNGVILITELLGNSVYKTNIAENTVFRSGKLNANGALTEECGCPISVPATQAGAVTTPSPAPQQNQSGEGTAVAGNAKDASAPLPADRPGQVHVEVDTPFVFRANPAGVKPYSVAKLNLASLPNVYFLQEKVDPVVLLEKPAQVSVQSEAATPAPMEKAQKKEKEKKGFLGRVGGFFSGLFHH
ncbi:MAG TPA: hypothetical protein VE783_08165 [Candidatus Limnocylindrales bacterium]|nr:hypothetical protein [Candidatus Limnocylindrales bacterium]